MKSSEEAPALAPARIRPGRPSHLFNESISNRKSCDNNAEIENEFLVQGCIQGNQQAWEELIDKYKRLIFSIPIMTYGASPEDAADVFQAVCIELLHSLVKLKNVGSLRAWLITVTLRQSHRWKRKQANHLELDAMESKMVEGITAMLPADRLAQFEREQMVREVVEK